jgi:hypothetical protein
MAVDTKDKRASATLFLVPSYAVGIFPDGAVELIDRYASAWMYNGLVVIITGIVELTLHSRSSALTLEARSVDLTLRPRSTELTVEPRSVDLTIRTRSTELTLEDR